MIALTFPGAKNSAGEIVPAFIRTNASIAAWLPCTAANNCWVAGDGGYSLARLQVNSNIAVTPSTLVPW